MPLPDALRRFADDIDDPSADLIIAALIINARLRGPGLRDVLGALAISVREELDMRRSHRRAPVHPAQRADHGPCRSAWPSGSRCSTRLRPGYDCPPGQLVLLVVVALFAGGFFWLRKLASSRRRSGCCSGPAGRHQVARSRRRHARSTL